MRRSLIRASLGVFLAAASSNAGSFLANLSLNLNVPLLETRLRPGLAASLFSAD